MPKPVSRPRCPQRLARRAVAELFLVAPTGEVLIVDWFRLDLTVLTDAGGGAGAETVRCAGAEKRPGGGRRRWRGCLAADPTCGRCRAGRSDRGGGVYSSTSGRYLMMESAAPLDGEISYLSALLDLHASPGPHLFTAGRQDQAGSVPAAPTADPFPLPSAKTRPLGPSVQSFADSGTTAAL